MEVSKELLKGHIDVVILSLLSNSDMYGYEIAKMVRTKSNSSFELKEGTLYLCLKRLEKRMWIASYWSDEQGPGGRRKYYRITDEGLYNFKLKIEEWNFVKKVIDAFLIGKGDRAVDEYIDKLYKQADPKHPETWELKE